jgi:hypothetical protein
MKTEIIIKDIDTQKYPQETAFWRQKYGQMDRIRKLSESGQEVTIQAKQGTFSGRIVKIVTESDRTEHWYAPTLLVEILTEQPAHGNLHWNVHWKDIRSISYIPTKKQILEEALRRPQPENALKDLVEAVQTVQEYSEVFANINDIDDKVLLQMRVLSELIQRGEIERARQVYLQMPLHPEYQQIPLGNEDGYYDYCFAVLNLFQAGIVPEIKEKSPYGFNIRLSFRGNAFDFLIDNDLVTQADIKKLRTVQRLPKVQELFQTFSKL